MCGELFSYDAATDRLTGSSPRVRGTRDPDRRGPLAHGFIPACAGNSFFNEYGFDSSPVHPRVCGELVVGEQALEVGPGSSPRVRGTPLDTS